jgi:hypothetical protein
MKKARMSQKKKKRHISTPIPDSALRSISLHNKKSF